MGNHDVVSGSGMPGIRVGDQGLPCFNAPHPCWPANFSQTSDITHGTSLLDFTEDQAVENTMRWSFAVCMTYYNTENTYLVIIDPVKDMQQQSGTERTRGMQTKQKVLARSLRVDFDTDQRIHTSPI